MSDRQVDLNLLKALDALLDERNVTRAAERLGVTQPAMSGMLLRLRESLDDPLFARAVGKAGESDGQRVDEDVGINGVHATRPE